jgi:hypothetical protein
MSVTLRFSSLSESELRAVLLAHHHEYTQDQLPSVMASYARDHDAGNVGPLVRVEGPSAYTVTTLPLTAESAERVCYRLARTQDNARSWEKVEQRANPEKPNIEKITVTMLRRLVNGGVLTRVDAESLSVAQRDEVLEVAAWSGYEDHAWALALDYLDILPLREGTEA